MDSPSAELSRPAWTIGAREFVVLMGLLQALQALAIDAMLPALAQISHDLGAAGANQRQLVVGLYLIFAGAGSLVPGTLADRFGRRPVVLGCVAGYVVFTAMAALVTSFDALLVSRAALGFASAGLAVLPPAIIRDRFSGDRMARLQSTIAMVFMIVPMIAPTLGQAVLLVAGWRWIFGMMALLGLAVLGWAWARLPESLDPGHRGMVHPAMVVRTMATIVVTRGAAGYVFGMALIQAAMWGYINSAQQLVAEHFGAGSRFPTIFGVMALAMATTNFVNARIVERFGARRVSHAALITYCLVSALQLATALSGRETLWSFVPLMTANMCMMSFIGANFASIAMQPFARTAGAAASAQAFIRIALAAILGAAVGQAYDGSARPLAIALLGAGTLAMALVLFSERGRLFRRLLPPGTPRPIA
ncbi:MAG: MFS transporter [Sphingomonadales bacterium]|nr:MFS transporter [Sphingomonadales bacterium]